MIRCDVLIAGGGPAGLAAAIALRQKGLDVLVADALCPPIDKACGEGLMPDASGGPGRSRHPGNRPGWRALRRHRFSIRAPLRGCPLRARDRCGDPPLATPFASGRALPAAGRENGLGQPDRRQRRTSPGLWMASPAPTATLLAPMANPPACASRSAWARETSSAAASAPAVITA